jgi:hypothetical protein
VRWLLEQADSLDTMPLIPYCVGLEEALQHFSGWLTPDSGTLKAMIEF